jgi:hypothetical protein
MSSITVSTLERKRSVEHTPIDLETALRQLAMLKEELKLEWLEAITANDRRSIMKQIAALQAILREPKKLVRVRVNFIFPGIFFPDPLTSRN